MPATCSRKTGQRFLAARNSYDLWPRHLGLAGLEVFRDSCSRLAYDGELLNYGAAQQFRFLKCLKIGACDELGNVVGGLNYIREV